MYRKNIINFNLFISEVNDHLIQAILCNKKKNGENEECDIASSTEIFTSINYFNNKIPALY